MARGREILLVGSFRPGALESSYDPAFASLGCRTHRFDMGQRVGRYCRLGPLGRLLNRFLPVEAWVRKANRDLVATAMELRPDVIVAVGDSPVRAGTLAQLAASCGAPLTLLWVDTLVNLDSATAAALPGYDLVFSYGKAPAEGLRRLGARRVEWLPLAADPALHDAGTLSAEDRRAYGCDVSFVGNWRPERERALTLVGRMEEIRLKVWGGSDWRRFAGANPVIRRAWQGRPLLGAEFAKTVAASRISLNLIDPTNYPCANMRFFEIPCAGGLQLCSPCPEMEEEFRDGEAVFYYRAAEELPAVITRLLSDGDLCRRVAQEGRRRVLSAHTYAHRAARVLDALGLAPA